MGLVLLVGWLCLPKVFESIGPAALDRVEVFLLGNGLKVGLAPSSGMEVTTVIVWVGMESVREPEGRQGLTPFFEHMGLKGSERFPSHISALGESKRKVAAEAVQCTVNEYLHR